MQVERFWEAQRTEDWEAFEELIDACQNFASAGNLLSFGAYTPKKYTTPSRTSIKQTLDNRKGESLDAIMG